VTRWSSAPAAQPPLSFAVSCGNDGVWTVEGSAFAQARRLPDLPAALDCARRACDAAPATIQVRVDGMYICMHQPKGWPRRMCAPGRIA